MEVTSRAPAFQDDDDPRFVNRARIVLMQHDDALRLVTIRSLLRQGCVVRIKRSLAQVIADLQSEPVHAALVDLAADLSPLSALHAANRRAVPIVVLTDAPVDPGLARDFPTVRLLQKPFAAPELAVALRLAAGLSGK